MADLLPATIESVRRTLWRYSLIDEPELNAALAACWRHLADPDRPVQARKTLAPVVRRFTEGFRTADVVSANVLLRPLR
jgi:hypothetical protein